MKTKAILLLPPAILGVQTAFSLTLPSLVLLSIYLLLLIWFKKIQKKEILVFFFVFSVFFGVASHAEFQNTTSLIEGESRIPIEFRSGVKIDGDSFRAIGIDTRTGEKILVTYIIRSEADKQRLLSVSFFGLASILEGELKTPSESRNPGGFHYRDYLIRKKVHWIFESETFPLAQAGYKSLSIRERLGKLRETEIRKIYERLPRETATLVSALIFGDQSTIPEKVEDAYVTLGITHLLAISGMQVSVLAGIALFVGIRLGVAREKMSFALILLLPMYAVLAGGSPSVNRAVIMAVILLMVPLGGTRNGLGPLDALALSFKLYLLVDPYTVFDAGFQLSYAVTFALLVSYKGLKEKGLTGIALLLTATLISQLSALPILLAHFYTVPLIGIVANLLFIPLYSFLFSPAVYSLYLLLLIFTTLPASIIGPINKLILFSEKIALSLSAIPAQFYPGQMGFWLLAFYSLLVVIIFTNWERQDKLLNNLLFLLIPFAVLFSQSIVEANFARTGEITLIDVGQGDSLFITLPGGAGNYLIDTGGSIVFEKKDWQERHGSFEPGKDIVIPFLKARGISTLDKLILTHGDQDHIGGAAAIIEHLKVKEIVLPKVTEKSGTEQAIIKMAAQKHIKVTEVNRGDKWQAGGAYFYVLSPEKRDSGKRNDQSIAIYTILGGKGWLFTGDLEERGEAALMEQYPRLKIDVLKAGHHGSKTSSGEKFVGHYHPKTVWISAGVNNRFGHPHTETIRRFEELGMAIYRTDLHGAITYTFYGDKGTFSTHLPYNALSKAN
ncbi:DNA internalization-related competence protein ComEC/Rec2 [Bacillus sp. FJAT-27225]|uniref:DNA internalization-related competence protein ComEC/Rec2 n=1 Tax=Bacillus sp. FJAT-27225 TaxID=1743144 RepID=UPI00080C2CCE|nr:DNA internalization-related competence protein ComEC/Rec2 [Bacillus sp. FJAT-27225]OCA91173.1 DNA internalization-related competence protein ComEC/Rec2 [Bacillus sp. FJAT-27225]